MEKPIEIDRELSWTCKPWKENKLITIDENGYFATIEFFIDKKGKDNIKILPLCHYPKANVTNNFWIFPESETVCIWSARMMHIYNNKTKKKNSFVPILSWKGMFDNAFELSPNCLYMHFNYMLIENKDPKRHIYVRYNQEKKKICDDDFNEIQKEQLLIQLAPYGRDFLACEIDYNNWNCEYFYYNIDTRERVYDNFTKKITELFSGSGGEIKINFKERFLISVIRTREKNEYILMTWNEDMNKFNLFPVGQFVPKGKNLRRIESISDDGHWVLFSVDGYKGLNSEYLYKYGFLNINPIYPGKMSPLMIVDDYYSEYSYWKKMTFFEHPVYGKSFIYSLLNSKIEKSRIHLYKMSDIEKEIEAKLKDAANKLVK